MASAMGEGGQVSHRLLPRHATIDLDHAVEGRIVTVALVGEDLTRFTHHLHRRPRDVDQTLSVSSAITQNK